MTSRDSDGDPWFNGSGVVSAFAGIVGSGIVCVLLVSVFLRPLEQALHASGQKENYRGQPWTNNCREWIYFDVVLDVDAIQRQLKLPACVQIHENLDPKSGTERGLYCTICKDAVVGDLSGPNQWPA